MVNNQSIDFGVYVNADDIALALREGTFSFDKYGIKVKKAEFAKIAINSGLVNEKFPESIFKLSYQLKGNALKLSGKKADERLAQIIADFLRKKLLKDKKRFSFETVFSHPSKLNIMREAKENGYKVYLYFVSTDSPEINRLRVKSRKGQGGHDVPANLIESRYYRSLNLLYDACQLSYQVYFFDNSKEGEAFNIFAHFKIENDSKQWDEIKQAPEWFLKYYTDKIKSS